MVSRCGWWAAPPEMMSLFCECFIGGVCRGGRGLTGVAALAEDLGCWRLDHQRLHPHTTDPYCSPLSDQQTSHYSQADTHSDLCSNLGKTLLINL